jgi:hypothetical protein
MKDSVAHLQLQHDHSNPETGIEHRLLYSSYSFRKLRDACLHRSTSSVCGKVAASSTSILFVLMTRLGKDVAYPQKKIPRNFVRQKKGPSFLTVHVKNTTTFYANCLRITFNARQP